jgi:exosortase
MCLLLAVCATFGWFWDPLVSVFSLTLENDRYQHYSHIVLIPFLSLYVLYLDRRAIFATMEWSPWLGSILMASGGAVSWSAGVSALEGLDSLSPPILSVVTVCWGAFLFCFGTKAFRAASFGLLLLIAMVPLPSFLLDPIIEFLQIAAAEGVDFLFQILGVPVFRQDVVFSLSTLTIEIAPECSGIRSSLALLICSLVAGHLFLQSAWAKLSLVFVVVPLTIIKNAVRIVVLSLLGNYVDPRFLTESALHHSGGIPLFFVSLMVLCGTLWMLRRWESSRKRLPALELRA